MIIIGFFISQIKLIDPSKIALQATKKYIQSCENIDDIKLISSYINNIKPSNLKTNDKSTTFHIFSNILDIEEVDIESIFNNMNKSITGVNYIVCVSPDYYSSNQKLDEFVQCFRDNLSDKELTIISERQETIDNPNNPSNPWKCYEKVFKIMR